MNDIDVAAIFRRMSLISADLNSQRIFAHTYYGLKTKATKEEIIQENEDIVRELVAAIFIATALEVAILEFDPYFFEKYGQNFVEFTLVAIGYTLHRIGINRDDLSLLLRIRNGLYRLVVVIGLIMWIAVPLDKYAGFPGHYLGGIIARVWALYLLAPLEKKVEKKEKNEEKKEEEEEEEC